MVMEYVKRPLLIVAGTGILAFSTPVYAQDSLKDRIDRYLQRRTEASEPYRQRSFSPTYSWLNTHVGGRSTTRRPFTNEKPPRLSIRLHPYGDSLIVRKQSPYNGSRVTRTDLDPQIIERRVKERLQLWLNRH